MGIKGIYKEIGTGKRVSLCKLAIDHLEQTGRPLRLAIDFAIWSFQAQAARGGANPAIRTLFYRLVRLLSLSIVPLFVFDGPNKPLFKRNKRSRGPGDSVSIAMAKRLIRLFGFHMHDAPGEAEAECALLQQQGVVDAVLSEDVDTIMFGCTLTLRNWSAEGSRASKTPTHVSAYDVAELQQGQTGLDREGMVLVALMSGGDYIPEGVPGCGVKVACEAAKAGFGRKLCRIKRSDPEGLVAWREELTEELRTNKSRFFRTKHKALVIPDEFPSVEVLRYYTHPVVSQAATVDKLKREFPRKMEIDIVGLRSFTAETFDWVYRIGAVKFIRVLAPSLLVRALMSLGHEELELDDLDVRQEVEAKVVRSINIRRTHFSTDATPELRISYMPNNVVGVDLDAEEDEVASTYGRSGLALNSDDEAEEQAEGAEFGPKKVFDPLQPDLAWVPETIAKLGVPLTVEDWEEKQRRKRQGRAKKTQPRISRKKAYDMPTGALDRYVKASKPVASAPSKEPDNPIVLIASSPPSLPPPSQQGRGKFSAAAPIVMEDRARSSTINMLSSSSKTTKPKVKERQPPPSLDVNPWTMASSQAAPQATRPDNVVIISSSPIAPTSPRASPPHGSYQRSALLDVDDEFHNIPSSSCNHVSPSPSPSPSARKSRTGVALSPRKHTRYPQEPATRPVARSTHGAKATAAAAAAAAAARRGSNRSRRTPDVTSTQASIKTFGRLSEALGKKNTVPVAKVTDPVSESDDELEELHNIGSKVPAVRRDYVLSPPVRSRSRTLEVGDGGGNSASSPHAAKEVIEIPSSPSAPSPPRAVLTESRKTRLYVPRSSDTGIGYFEEIEVSPATADRMMAGQADELGERRPGGRRVWRQSEVSIHDLMGED
ncbi:hypothetical protein VPNG_05152 [Cytospora leucostoma]|uniref:XPG-I domain-containing protein n=1 Tax=Cytospora leucostoma TaxID=1230097 RepID=A0A423X457_9PEZI|nr:hypothetical protein VPNG_05152 [Cytospora leucostoma]